MGKDFIYGCKWHLKAEWQLKYLAWLQNLNNIEDIRRMSSRRRFSLKRRKIPWFLILKCWHFPYVLQWIWAWNQLHFDTGSLPKKGLAANQQYPRRFADLDEGYKFKKKKKFFFKWSVSEFNNSVLWDNVEGMQEKPETRLLQSS